MSDANGLWLASHTPRGAALYLHAAPGTGSDDPVTFFWGGHVEVHVVMNFFFAMLAYARSMDGAVRCLIGTPDQDIETDKADSALDRSDANFIRFQHIPVEKASCLENSDYALWAELGGTDPAVIDNIGVYLKPSRVEKVSGDLASFISQTGFQHPPREEGRRLLGDLSERIKKARSQQAAG